MKKRPPNVLILVLALFAQGAVLATAQTASAPNYLQERSQRAKALTQPYGWFSLIALEWIKPGLNTIGSAKDNSIVLPKAPAHLMTLNQTGGKVELIAADKSLTVAGTRPELHGAHPVISADEGDKSAMAVGALHMWAINRGDKRYLRVKDSEAPTLKQFHGLRWYAPQPQYRVTARWIPYSGPHTLQVINKLGQKTPTKVPGYVEFEIDGKKQKLVPMEASPEELFFVFRDMTFLKTTDGGRFLTTAGPSAGLNKPGTVVLDFNSAVNPPCAYSPFATCPLASPENRLPVSIPAGEKRYED
ncbi:DUF1684 domain-containing protein [Terriglobus saanensis]|uniref:DUF1684 domain-containing protein n=1 Tax=Terriglobus saanensis (strain ATCC BAA-1853 / DSM 23119 / SP1PR4) TaxID=401053 RepID=E8V2W6_TERSS|nr:DUF1684 domain-containing protein [Terriglobus saanensis]ADV84663.1 protein of unknown function DUF1684 [Terriglobus saanensis SP1PR4]